MRIRLGTRGSELARTQSGLVADALRRLGHEVELVIVRTEGDTNRASLRSLGGLGVFAAALRAAVLAGDVDIAVHSCKDLPVAPVDGLAIAAMPSRADDRDVLVGAPTLADLPPDARVGTGSPRRGAQVLAARPDVRIIDIRGNVGTRIGYVRDGELDAVVLAAAGLSRLGLFADGAAGGVPGGVLDLWPAPAQGALAIECRADDAGVGSALAPLDDPATRLAVTAERAVLAGLQAGCAAPVGVRSSVTDGHYRLSVRVWSEDGTRSLTASRTIPRPDADPDDLGRRLSSDLIVQGAAEICDLRGTSVRR